MNIRNLSIKRKLMLITMLTSALALAAGIRRLRRVRPAGVSPPDERRPHDAGRGHRVEQHCRTGVSGREDGAARSCRRSRRGKGSSRRHSIRPTISSSRSTDAMDGPSTAVPARPGRQGSRFEGNHLTVFHDIVLHGETLGTRLHRVGHAAVERAGEPLHRHRRRADARLGALGAARVVAPAAGDFRTDSGAGRDDEKRLGPEEFLAAGREIAER